MPPSRYSRQRGLLVQDIVEDLSVVVHGSGAALPYFLQCLALVGAGSRHGHIRLVGAQRPITEDDLKDQFLLDADSVGDPLGEWLMAKIADINPAIHILCSDAPAARTEIVVAVPRPEEVERIRDAGAIDLWGHVLPAAVLVGPAPARVPVEESNSLTAALAGVCGGLLAQAVLGAAGALLDGPTVTSVWSEEHLRIAAPGIGVAARAAVHGGAPAPELAGVMERISNHEQANRFALLLDGAPARAAVIAVLNENEILASVMTSDPNQIRSSVIVRPSRRPAVTCREVFWSPVDGVDLADGGRLPTHVTPPALDPATQVVMCGAGALGSWASAALAASGAALHLSVVDMDGTVEAHNLNRQVLFTPGDVGAPKAVRTVERLRGINPRMTFDAIPIAVGVNLLLGDQVVDLTAVLAGTAELAAAQSAAKDRGRLVRRLTEASAILCCPDNQQTRWTLNVLAEEFEVPLINGAIDGFVGRVHVCDPRTSSMCLVCWLGASIAEEPERHSCTDAVGPAPVQSIATSAAIVGCAQAAALILSLGGAEGAVNRFHTWDGTTVSLDGYRAGDRDPIECPDHLMNSRALRREEDHGYPVV